MKGIAEHIMDLPWDTPISGGESKAAFTLKITQSFNRWLTTHEGDLLFVAHGFVYASLLHILKLPLCSADLEPKNATLMHFRHDGNKWLVESS